jgi:hypothetical protein
MYNVQLTQATVESLCNINPRRLEGIAHGLRVEAKILWRQRRDTHQTDMQWDEWWNSYIVKLDYDELMEAAQVISIIQASLEVE